MKRTMIASLLLIIACKEEKKETTTPNEPQVKNEMIHKAEPQANEAEEARKWLVKSIEDYFKADLVAQDKIMQKMTTKDYFEYKTDATNVDMDIDGSLTEREFQDKWRKKFDVQKAGVGYGFLITGQDWEEIKVSSCKILAEGQHDFLFEVILSDKKLKAEYPITVSVIKDHNSFLIADVWQKEPKLN
nr:hypothetical protein [uncultured Chryseobacterium sp.]